jgi:hypothetical protein
VAFSGKVAASFSRNSLWSGVGPGREKDAMLTAPGACAFANSSGVLHRQHRQEYRKVREKVSGDGARAEQSRSSCSIPDIQIAIALCLHKRVALRR